MERLPVFTALPSEENLQLFTTQVHALKSASATIGAENLFLEAAALETAGKASDFETISKTIHSFHQHLFTLAQDIKRVLEEVPDTEDIKTETYNIPVVSPLFETLRIALQSKNIKKADKTLKELETVSSSIAISRTIAAVSELILMGDYNDAIEKIDALFTTGRQI
jgi:HPt (histidine-containing phosphotransfer) domain-containing protein